MKTEFLSSLGLDKEVIDKIMAENGKDIEAEKAKSTALKSEIDTLRTDKQTLEQKITELTEAASSGADYKQQLEELQKSIKEKEEADRIEKEDAMLTSAIEECFGDKKFTSDYVKNGIIADMKIEIAKPENKGKGYSEIFEAFTKDKEGIFANPNPPAPMPGLGGFETNASEDAMRAVMGLGPIKE